MNQRLIKLRTWNAQQGEFIPLLNLQTSADALVQAFTGVYDYFGREVWEGDIVKWTAYLDDQHRYVEYYYEVVFENGCFGTVDAQGGEFSPFETAQLGDTVAGNACEHRYLLAQSLDLSWP